MDCETCALADLRDAGYSRTRPGGSTDRRSPSPSFSASGSSVLDHSVAKMVVADWKAIGIRIAIVNETSDDAAAHAAATGNVDVALFARPTETNPSYAGALVGGSAVPRHVSEWRAYRERDDTLWRRSIIFNPVTATPTWLQSRSDDHERFLGASALYCSVAHHMVGPSRDGAGKFHCVGIRGSDTIVVEDAAGDKLVANFRSLCRRLEWSPRRSGGIGRRASLRGWCP